MRLFATLCLIPLVACTPAPMQVESAPMSSTSPGTLFVGSVVAAGPLQTPMRDAAVYVEEGLIRDVGTEAAMRSAHPGAREVDARGATILPGLIDAHAHLYGLGLALRNVDLVAAPSFDEVVRRVRERAKDTAAGQWVIGRGWDQNEWPVKEFPTAAALDAAVPDHPVFLRRVDGHAALANSAAMKLAGVTAATADPAGGRIIRDAAGNPSGVFVDNAMAIVEDRIPQPDAAERKALVLAAANEIARNGLTGIHDAGIGGPTIATVRELIREGSFPIRVSGMLADDDALLDSWFRSGPLLDEGGKLTIRSVKLYADGALGSRGAALLAPYSDEPANSGLVLTSRNRIAEVAGRARKAGFQVNTHAIGDRAVREVIDAYGDAGVTPADRFRIEHLQVIAPDDVPRLVARGIVASMQPTHATSDMDWAERRLGPDRIRGAYAWRTVLNAGGRLALGSDFPVEYVNPFFGIYSAVTRQDHEGKPAEGWYPGERLTLAEALRGFTLDAAWAGFDEKTRGTIEPGKLADFTIVEGDFFADPVARLWDAKVRCTVVGGEIVWTRQD
jgi:predicted amidohydrolase YtcJ